MKKLRMRSLFGRIIIAFEARQRLQVMNLLLKNNIEYGEYSEAEEKGQLVCPKSAKKALTALAKSGHYTIIGEKGLVSYLRRSLRPGLVVGAVLAVLLVLCSGLFVWDVRIVGNETVDDDTILEELSNAGFGVGSFLPGADLSAVKNRFLQKSDAIGWISINLHGSVAVAEVMEKKKSMEVKETAAPCNLVAATDAVITEVAVETGEACVKVGQVVKAGDLLVSGVLEGSHQTRFVTASGKILGQYEQTFSVTVPFHNTKKKVTEERTQQISINFFGYAINIFKDTGNPAVSYDTIYVKKQYSLFGVLPLPVSREEVVYRMYEEVPEEWSEAEAAVAAGHLLRAEMEQTLKEKSVISRQLTGSYTEDGYTLTCHVVLVGDISRVMSLSVGENSMDPTSGLQGEP